MKTKLSLRYSLVAVSLLGIFPYPALAGPGALDPSYFATVSGGPVNAMAFQPDGKLLLGGAFSSVNYSYSRSRLARLWPDGSLDTSFFNSGNGVSSTVYCLAVQTDGRIVVGGDFASINGTARSRVARLNPNGAVDNSFAPTNTINQSVLALAAQSDNKLIIGGNFTGAGLPAWIARLNADGTVDTAFSAAVNGGVNAIAVQSDGKIVLGGSFTTVNGATRNRIARLNADGSLDNTFAYLQSGAPATVRCLQIQNDGKILLGGDFTSVNGVSRYNVARLNSNGLLDTGFASLGQTGISGPVYAIAVQPDSSIVVAGNFSSSYPYTLSRVARLYADGTRDPGFSTFGISATVQALALQGDGAVLVGGAFTSISNTNWPYFGRLYGNLYPPEFISQPVSHSTNVGASVSFSALVSNPTSSSFQWRKDGNNISGATSMSYTLRNVQFADAGNYSVFVSNGAGGTTSTNALLLVGIAPAIVQQPVSLTVTQGQPATFAIGATGAPLNYFWKKNGAFIPGATNTALTFSSAVSTNAGTYTCVVSNFLGSVTSSGAVLAVLTPPTITRQPGSLAVGVGSSFTLSVTASGTGPLVYQWVKDGRALTGMTNSNFTCANAQSGDAGGYCVVVTNTVGGVTSAVANVSLRYSPSDGLVAYYPFNGNANDASGNGNHGLLNGPAPTTDRFGAINSAYHFGGNGDYVAIPDSPSFLSLGSNFTLSAWVKDELGGTGSSRILSKGWETNVTGNAFELYLSSGDTLERAVYFYVGNSTGHPTLGSSGTIQAGTWNLLTVTYDGAALTLFINGAADASLLAAGLVATNSSALWIGRNSGSVSNDYFAGSIDDVRLYNRALSPAEMQQLYAGDLQAGMRLRAQAVTDGVSLSFPAGANLAYSVLFTTNLTSGSWQKLADVPAQSTNGSVQLLDPAATSSPQRFYRLVTPPWP